MTICERMAQRAVDEAHDRHNSGMSVGLPIAKMYASHLQLLINERKWHDIGSAPVERWCLFYDGHGTMRESKWCKTHVDMIPEDSHCGTVNAYFHNYTHWMPLPEPPG